MEVSPTEIALMQVPAKSIWLDSCGLPAVVRAAAFAGHLLTKVYGSLPR